MQNHRTELETDASLSDFLVSPAELLAKRPDIHNIIGGALVFRQRPDTSPGKPVYETLLLKRAASDSFPLRWEVPGGTADLQVDGTIIDVAARELFEETRLQARKAVCAVGLGQSGNGSGIGPAAADASMDDKLNICLLPVDGLIWAIAVFIVEVTDTTTEIVLQDEEHEDWAWVTEAEVEERKFHGQSDGSLECVTEAMRMIVLEGFRLRKGF
ncbi:hypothetical protein CPLU01_07893 [Colletotrichum plurivorum]|uniref:Nudix hydrolase domain-containing protein n=1 Tax=Colletotrichum plurivorum TaxID=2175906 RepID=A0A8H6NDG0_9PEZI|nr:hypothetical protein CPLU01_07893 [Colletotrichum plurivorum]